MTFRFLEHTADVVLEVESTSFGELLAEAARGFTDCITDVELVRPRQRIEVTTGAPDREGLLVGWLNELLFRFETEGFLACAGEVGEPYDPERHPFRTAVKGATWHNLNIESDGRDWHAVVVLDV
jgi:SHS2 domain-containing protein